MFGTMGMEKREEVRSFPSFPSFPARLLIFDLPFLLWYPVGASTEERGPESSNVKTKSVYQSTIRFAKFGRAL